MNLKGSHAEAARNWRHANGEMTPGEDYHANAAFLAGVAWRDANPGPEANGMADAIAYVLQYDQNSPERKRLSDALAAFDAVVKERDEARWSGDVVEKSMIRLGLECDQLREQVARLEGELANCRLVVSEYRVKFENALQMRIQVERLERELAEAKALGSNHTFTDAEYFKKLQAENAELRAELEQAGKDWATNAAECQKIERRLETVTFQRDCHWKNYQEMEQKRNNREAERDAARAEYEQMLREKIAMAGERNAARAEVKAFKASVADKNGLDLLREREHFKEMLAHIIGFVHPERPRGFHMYPTNLRDIAVGLIGFVKPYYDCERETREALKATEGEE